MTLLSIDPATPDTGGLLYRGIKLTSEAKVTRLIIHRKIEISGFADGLKLLTFCRLMLGTNFKNQMACLVSFMRFKLLNPANTQVGPKDFISEAKWNNRSNSNGTCYERETKVGN